MSSLSTRRPHVSFPTLLTLPHASAAAITLFPSPEEPLAILADPSVHPTAGAPAPTDFAPTPTPPTATSTVAPHFPFDTAVDAATAAALSSLGAGAAKDLLPPDLSVLDAVASPPTANTTAAPPPPTTTYDLAAALLLATPPSAHAPLFSPAGPPPPPRLRVPTAPLLPTTLDPTAFFTSTVHAPFRSS
ncbi:hypothetical protein HDU96_010936, partial [Phlyctochytrium bullatum]